jgi:hypothetical protein
LGRKDFGKINRRFRQDVDTLFGVSSTVASFSCTYKRQMRDEDNITVLPSATLKEIARHTVRARHPDRHFFSQFCSANFFLLLLIRKNVGPEAVGFPYLALLASIREHTHARVAVWSRPIICLSERACVTFLNFLAHLLLKIQNIW